MWSKGSSLGLWGAFLGTTKVPSIWREREFIQLMNLQIQKVTALTTRLKADEANGRRGG